MFVVNLTAVGNHPPDDYLRNVERYRKGPEGFYGSLMATLSRLTRGTFCRGSGDFLSVIRWIAIPYAVVLSLAHFVYTSPVADTCNSCWQFLFRNLKQIHFQTAGMAAGQRWLWCGFVEKESLFGARMWPHFSLL